MVVAFLTTEYPTEPSFAGGIASYVNRIATLLVSAGHEVEVFVSGTSSESFMHEGLRVTRVRPDYRWLPRVVGRPFVWQFQEAARLYDQAQAFERAVSARSNDRRIDVVQSPDFMAPGLTLAFRGRIPLVTRLSHYGPLWQAAYRYPATAGLRQQNIIERHQKQSSRAVYAPSRFIAERVAAAEGIDVRVIRPPFDISLIAQYGAHAPGYGLVSGNYALFFGTLGLIKGVDRLIKVLPHVLSACPSLHFVFAGSVRRSETGQPFDQVIREQFPHRVLTLPALHHKDLLPVVAGARFVVLPSRVDNLPNACLEAMALARPVIATCDASFEELIAPGVTGELVSQHEDDDLSRAMIRLWNADSSRLADLGNAAQRKIATEFTHVTALSSLLELFDSVVQQCAKPRSARYAQLLTDVLQTATGSETGSENLG